MEPVGCGLTPDRGGGFPQPVEVAGSTTLRLTAPTSPHTRAWNAFTHDTPRNPL